MPSKRRDMLAFYCAEAGIYCRTYSPGDGVTRYRFFDDPGQVNDYFGPGNGFYTALGLAEALAFAEGFMRGKGSTK